MRRKNKIARRDAHFYSRLDLVRKLLDDKFLYYTTKVPYNLYISNIL
jgi:hypothetical protein